MKKNKRLFIFLLGGLSFFLFLFASYFYAINNFGVFFKLKDNEILTTNPSEIKSLKNISGFAVDDTPNAMGHLAKEYFDGVVVQRNDEKAFFWAKKGDQEGDSLSTFLLARMYYDGIGVNQDQIEAVQLLDKIKDKRVDAQYVLGEIYLSQYLQNKKDLNLAKQGWSEILNAADKGYAPAQYKIANNYRKAAIRDNMNQKLLAKSIEYLALASAQGNLKAQRQMAYYLIKGIGIRAEKEVGLNLLNSLATLNDQIAIKYLNNIQELPSLENLDV